MTASAAGPFSFGIKAGVPLTDFVDAATGPRSGFQSVTNRYIVGPSAELRLPFGLGVELDALYRRMNYSGSTSLVDVITSSRTTGNAWEFPLLVKYRFPAPLVRPYVAAGAAWDTLSGLRQSVTGTVIPTRISTSTSTGTPAELKHNTIPGFVLGAGVDIHALILHIAPEIRYTRWSSPHFSDGTGLLGSQQNQAEFLLGITF